MPFMVRFETYDDPDEAIRARWGRNLAEVLELSGVSRKELVARLKAQGAEVSVQAVSLWISGQSAPRPHLMILIASTLNVPARVLFSLDSTIVKAVAA